MSRTILIYGQSGAGKTTSCRHLNPKHTFYIDCDGKGLSWHGWRKSFNAENKNYIRSDTLDPTSKRNLATVIRSVAASDAYSHIKTIVVDGLTTVMTLDVMRRADEKGFDKWRDLAYSVLQIIRDANYYRDDLDIVFIGHVDTDDESVNPVAHLKTSGRKLGQIVLESFFTTVLYAKTDGENYWFETTARNSTAKAPKGALDDRVDNDLAAVLVILNLFENADILAKPEESNET